MALEDIRQRTRYLFLVVILGHILLISAQVNSRRGVPVLEAVTFGIFSEVQRAASSVVSAGRNVWSGYIGLRQAHAENQELKRQLADAQITMQAQQALADRARSLEQVLELRDRVHVQTAAATIIGATPPSPTPDFRTVTIDKGTREGLRPDMAVVAPLGVVGRIVVPAVRSAKVQLLIDRNAAAGALIERSRAQGVVIGTGEERLRMEYVSEVADVVVGDIVVTSGIDGIYPKGFIIGRVEAVEKTGPTFKRISVRPAVDFLSLEEVLVITTPPPVREGAEGTSE
ncbi:MAG: rod shape-determining protein MreC [Acidobacteria bacterium]|nr:MAG: rod shape-determining protein MreC [Acidobacteriota bacterium]